MHLIYILIMWSTGTVSDFYLYQMRPLAPDQQLQSSVQRTCCHGPHQTRRALKWGSDADATYSLSFRAAYLKIHFTYSNHFYILDSLHWIYTCMHTHTVKQTYLELKLLYTAVLRFLITVESRGAKTALWMLTLLLMSVTVHSVTLK